MARAAAARAEAAPARAPSHRPAAPKPARRRSGPAPRPARSAPAKRPTRGARTAPAPLRRRAVTAALARFLEARTAGLLDRLLRGRLWVGCVGVLLVGIVFLNVSLLQLNQDIARTTAQATALDRQNSALRAKLAAFDSSEMIQREAQVRGMIMPAPGQYRYLRAHVWLDAELAARRATPPRSLAAAPPAVAPQPATVASAGTIGTAAPTGTPSGTPLAAAPTAAAPTATSGP